MNSVLIYSEKNSNRLKYILDFTLGELLGLKYEVTSDKNRFENFSGPKFSYATQPVGNEIFFERAELLFETDITHQPINFSEHGELTGVYPTSDKSLISFDFLATSFLLLTRYSEYLPHKKDKYDRYRASQSFNYQGGFLDKPVVNYYALELKKILSAKYPELKFKENKFEYIPTFDIDMAFSYREKGFQTNFGGFVRSFFLSDFKDISNRFMVLAGRRRDPFDNFDFIFRVTGIYNLKTVFFILLGNKSRFDKSIPHTSEVFRKLVKSIAEKTETGIHLSYASHGSEEAMKMEIKRLEEITGVRPTRNRFHFLRFHIPNSYLKLIKLGIKEDHSMGHASRIGFRAGTCNPFYFFNLKTNEATDFKIYPFAFMDTTFVQYNKVSSSVALDRILQLMKYVKEVEGPLVGLWHNSSFTEEKKWKGWKKVFETVAQEASVLMQRSE